MAGIKELKTRIRSIQSTRKITRAMQLVSAAKMRKSQERVLKSREYAQMAWNIIQHISQKSAFKNPLTRVYPNAKKIGIVLLSTNRGFVGSLNTNLIPKVHEALGHDEKEVLSEIVTFGKKGNLLASRMKKEVVADFPKEERFVTVEEIFPLAQFITERYSGGQYIKIVMVYNHFFSTVSQKPTIKQLLPFVNTTRSVSDDGYESEYMFEPSPQIVIEYLIPRIIESQIYQAILESDASEHSARMVMMKNATEAAKDLIADLTLTYNQLRQNKITTELAEITAGKIALE